METKDVYNVLSHGFSIGMTPDFKEAESWKRLSSDPNAVIVRTNHPRPWEVVKRL